MRGFLPSPSLIWKKGLIAFARNAFFAMVLEERQTLRFRVKREQIRRNEGKI
jgi:hypothetical protein